MSADAEAEMVAISTLRDAAGAEVTRELLAEYGIPVEIRRLALNAYFGSPTSEEYEVRVPADRADEALELLEGVSEELERAARAEAGIAPDQDEAPEGDDLPPPERRERKLAWAVALGLVGPLPGCGLLYARAPRLGWTFAGASLALFAAAVIGSNGDALGLVAALKGADVLLAPLFAARFNRRLRATAPGKGE